MLLAEQKLHLRDVGERAYLTRRHPHRRTYEKIISPHARGGFGLRVKSLRAEHDDLGYYDQQYDQDKDEAQEAQRQLHGEHHGFDNFNDVAHLAELPVCSAKPFLRCLARYILIRMPCSFSSADRSLAARLEAADAANVATLARALSSYMPEALCEPIAGGVAVFAGAGSPMTHVVGMGLRGTVAADELERMESFFRERGSDCVIDLCPLADASVLDFVARRPYKVAEFNNVLARRIAQDETFAETGGLTLARETELGSWSRVVSEGFSDGMPVSDEMVELMAATCRGAQCWLAGADRAAGGAAMGVEEGVALFFGDAIVPAARGKGWQAAMIRARLAAAQRQGCDLAMVSVLPGSLSHRNYEQAGFELVYTRANLQREFGEAAAG